MRLVVDNWILTTVKQTENEQVDLTIDQRVEQEQNLFDTSRSDSESSQIIQTNGKSLNERIVDEMEKTSHTIENFMSKIDEFLNENSIELPDVLNETNTIKDFSNYLFNILDIYTYRDIEIYLEDFQKIRNYVLMEQGFMTNDQTSFNSQTQIIEYIKNTLKSKHLLLTQSRGLFEQFNMKLFAVLNERLSDTNLKECKKSYDKIRIDYLNRLDNVKTMLKLKINKLENSVNIWTDFENICYNLDQIFTQNQCKLNCSLQYRSLSIEINNLINRLKEKLNLLTNVLNESKYFEFKNKIVIYEIKFKKFKEINESVLIQSPEARVPTSATVPVLSTPKSIRESVQVPVYYEFRQKTVITSDKSTFTVHNESTQTDPIYDTVMHSDGKKMLLEAYLRENLTCDSGSSKKVKSESGTGMTRESGIGTANDDEGDSLPLTDVDKPCDDERLNLSTETYPMEVHKKFMRKKLNKLKSISTLSTSSTSSSSKLEDKNVIRKRKVSKELLVKSNQQLTQQQSNESILKCLIKKIIKFLLIFLIPFLFILLILAYVLYRSYLNPHCCDFKRNYLFINVT